MEKIVGLAVQHHCCDGQAGGATARRLPPRRQARGWLASAGWLVFGLCGVLGATPGFGWSEFSEPVPLSSHAATDPPSFTPRPGVGFDDNNPAVATDGAGVWVAVWGSDDAQAGVTPGAHTLVFARSADDGATWSDPALVRAEFASDLGIDRPALATDGQGRWVAVWLRVTGTLVTTRSTDNGVTWEAPQEIGPDEGLGPNFPAVAADGAGSWVVTWTAAQALGGSLGPDDDILYIRSTNDAQTWSSPSYLNTNAPVSTIYESVPRIAGDGSGVWVAVWDANGAATQYARSTDNAVTWSSPVSLGSAGNGGGEPELATDRQGHWVVVWLSEAAPSSEDRDVYFSRSSDNGATWAPQAPLHPDLAAWRKVSDGSPRVSAYDADEWQVVWMSTDSLGASLGNDFDLLTSHSRDGGQTWSGPSALFARAAHDGSAEDYDPTIVMSATGKALVVWSSTDSLEGTVGEDWDILVSSAKRDCSSTPRGDCLAPTRPGASKLSIKDGFLGRDGLTWSLRYGEATTNADLGSPATTSGYALCLYDELGMAPGLLAEWEADAGSTCDGVPCWTEEAGTVSYRDSHQYEGPIRTLQIRSGEEGKSSIRLKAGSAALSPPRLPLPVSPSVRTQLVNLETNVCWEASFTAASRNEATQFKATSD